MPDLWDIVGILVKTVLYVSILTASGTVFAARLIGSELGAYRKTALGFAALGLIASGVVFAMRGVALTGDVIGMADPEILDLLWQTSVGNVLLLRIGGLGLLIWGLVLPGSQAWVSVLGGLLAIWSFAQIGHVPSQSNIWLNGILALHLICIAFWIGILIPLRRLTLIPSEIWRAGDVAHRFGLIALGAVPVLLAAGGYLAYVLVGSIQALTTADYGKAVMLKLGLVSGLLIIGAVNKLRFVPKMREGNGQGANGLARTIRYEWVLFVIVLLTTAALTTALTPPAS